MKKILIKAAIVAAVVGLSVTVQAAPKKTAKAAKESVHLSTDTKVMPVALHQANRIHVDGGRVLRAIGNSNMVQFNHDEETGSLYVFPMVPEQVTIYVITEYGETHSITLSPKEKIPSQTITIRENYLSGNFSKASFEAPLEAPNPQSVIQAIGTLDTSKGKKFKDTKRSDGNLVAEPASYFDVGGLRLERWILKNPTAESQLIYEGNFYRTGDLAIATLISELPSKGRTDLWIVKEHNNGKR